MGGASLLPSPWKNTLLSPNTTSPVSRSTLALTWNRPSLGRTSRIFGESPQRSVTVSGVRSTTSKWSVTTAPTGNDESLMACLSHSWRAVSAERYFLSRIQRWRA